MFCLLVCWLYVCSYTYTKYDKIKKSDKYQNITVLSNNTAYLIGQFSDIRDGPSIMSESDIQKKSRREEIAKH